MKEPLLGKTMAELQQLAVDMGLPKYTATQLADWLYAKRAVAIDEMTNLSKAIRAQLSEKYEMGISLPEKVQRSNDAVKKYLFSDRSGNYFETAVIPDKDRITVCVSSQAGCKMGCLFCMTGKQGFQGQLTANEIVNQIRSIDEAATVTNIVYMGMGEPFDNTEEVLKSIDILTSERGFAMSPRRITVSTIGVIPGMLEFLNKSEAHLAVSLHSPFEDERRKLMPIQARYPIDDVVRRIRNSGVGGQRRVSFEYIMFKGINDTDRHVTGLLRLLNGVKCRLNLIHFHPVPGVNLEGSDETTIAAFKDRLNEKGLLTTIRASRGMDICAACGLLSTKEFVKKPKTNRSQTEKN
ncbi:MAG: 23S rRNA (adenine(2503)-C(2))-methyltransferase RlmN [Prolixibacteraceae bacterium]|nr:23S rRNA (adenine(2503)-C(2))-methyltransferase RlmN [Prolixibacteraceae bacterium]